MRCFQFHFHYIKYQKKKFIDTMNLKTNILMSDDGKWLEGILNPAGNHRKKGCVAGGAIKMETLKIPDSLMIRPKLVAVV